MPSNLLIVESPAKTKKIQDFLKNHSESFVVESSIGHIRNTPSKALNIDVENDFKPTYIIMPDKKTTVAKLKKLSDRCQTVWLATDPDREGEAIAWHLSEVLKLSKAKRKRISFTEITKNAVCNALKKPGDIDMNMFYSQQARMVIDKIIGYEVSPLLWNKFGFIKVNKSYISAGRVLSAVSAIVSQRHSEIEKFSSKSYFRVVCDFSIKKGDDKFLIKDTILVGNIEDYDSAHNLLNRISKGKLKFTIKSGSNADDTTSTTKTNKTNKTNTDDTNTDDTNTDDTNTMNKFKCLDMRITQRRAPAPFVTSSLQQEASTKLGLSPKISMRIAQDLYEGGFITYMRTDSTMLADSAMNEIKTHVTQKYGKNYYNYLQYKAKGSSTQGGHEACRPVSIIKTKLTDSDKLTDMGGGPRELTNRHKKLYQLIWRRTVASQMKPVKAQVYTVKIQGKDGTKNHVFVGKYEKIIFDGWTILYNKTDTINEEDDDGDNEDHSKTMTSSIEKKFAKLSYGDKVYMYEINANEKYTKPPVSYFTEASLVKHIEKLGIGRPSTFASTVHNIQDKGYVSKTDKEPIEKTCRNLTLVHSDDEISEELTKVKVGGEKNKLLPTSLGINVSAFLENKLKEIVDYRFTSKIEELLDKIASGKCDWVKVVRSFYQDFKPTVSKLLVKIKSDKQEKRDAQSGGGGSDSKYSNNIILGKHPKTGTNVVAYNSRRGPMVCLENEDAAKRRYASIQVDINDITLEKACSLLIYPKLLGEYKGKHVQLCKSNNYYLKYGDKNISIEYYEKNNKTTIQNKASLDLDDVKPIIDAFIKASTTGPFRTVGSNIEILKGPYGYYIKYKKKINIPLPRGKKTESEIKKLTDDDIQEIIDKSGKVK